MAVRKSKMSRRKGRWRLLLRLRWRYVVELGWTMILVGMRWSSRLCDKPSILGGGFCQAVQTVGLLKGLWLKWSWERASFAAEDKYRSLSLRLCHVQVVVFRFSDHPLNLRATPPSLRLHTKNTNKSWKRSTIWKFNENLDEYTVISLSRVPHNTESFWSDLMMTSLSTLLRTTVSISRAASQGLASEFKQRVWSFSRLVLTISRRSVDMNKPATSTSNFS